MYIPPVDDVVMHKGREDKGLGGKVNLDIGFDLIFEYDLKLHPDLN